MTRYMYEYDTKSIKKQQYTGTDYCNILAAVALPVHVKPKQDTRHGLVFMLVATAVILL